MNKLRTYTLPESTLASVDKLAARMRVTRTQVVIAAIKIAAEQEHEVSSPTIPRTRGDRLRPTSIKIPQSVFDQLQAMANKYTHGNLSRMLRRICLSIPAQRSLTYEPEPDSGIHC